MLFKLASRACQPSGSVDAQLIKQQSYCMPPPEMHLYSRNALHMSVGLHHEIGLPLFKNAHLS